MKKITTLLLFITIFIITTGYSQIETFSISLQEHYGLDMEISFNYNKLYEIKNLSKYEIPEGIDNFTVGCLEFCLQYLGYKQVARTKKGRTMLAKQGIDTLQFYVNPKTTKLYALLYMQNGVKNLVLDTDFDNSFINEKVYSFDFNTLKHEDESAFVYADLQLPMDSLQHSTVKTIPVKILMNDIYPNDKIGNNDSLQVYISPNFFYQGYFMSNVDTVFVNMKIQNFDLLYNKLLIEGTYYYKKLMNPKHFDYYSKKPIQIGNRKYQFEDCDVINKTLTLTRLKDDSIGTNRGNYLASMPELDSLGGYTLLFFTGSWCKPCKILLDTLLLFYKQHPETTIISVNRERDSTQFITYLNKYQIPWKVILDMEPKIENPYLALKEFFDKDSKTEHVSYCDFYDVNAFPTLFLINPQRKILYVAEGHIQGIELLKKIDKERYENLEILLE